MFLTPQPFREEFQIYCKFFSTLFYLFWLLGLFLFFFDCPRSFKSRLVVIVHNKKKS